MLVYFIIYTYEPITFTILFTYMYFGPLLLKLSFFYLQPNQAQDTWVFLYATNIMTTIPTRYTSVLPDVGYFSVDRNSVFCGGGGKTIIRTKQSKTSLK